MFPLRLPLFKKRVHSLTGILSSKLGCHYFVATGISLVVRKIDLRIKSAFSMERINLLNSAILPARSFVSASRRAAGTTLFTSPSGSAGHTQLQPQPELCAVSDSDPHPALADILASQLLVFRSSARTESATNLAVCLRSASGTESMSKYSVYFL